MDEKFEKYVPKVVFVIAFILLIVYVLKFYPIDFAIDTTTILLLLILLISPYASKITRIKVGPFEAEIIKSREVQDFQKSVEKLPKTEKKESRENYPFIQYIADDIFSSLDVDKVVALAKLRFEIEEIINKFLKFTNKQNVGVSGLKSSLRILNKEGILNENYVDLIGMVVSFSNRILHGEKLKEKDGEVVVEYGLKLLDELYFKYINLITEPVEKKEISKIELDDYFNSKYEVTTVIPYVENPVIQRRILTQDEFDTLLDGYEEYAEFIVDVKKLE
mgnify:CR=1 FL=1